MNTGANSSKHARIARRISASMAQAREDFYANAEASARPNLAELDDNTVDAIREYLWLQGEEQPTDGRIWSIFQEFNCTRA